MNYIDVERQGAVTTIWLNDPATLNAVSAGTVEELSSAIEEANAVARALVISSRGRAFSSGANLGALAGQSDLSDPDAGAMLESHIHPLIRQLTALDIPWISAVKGAAAGVGCSIALAADLIVAGESAYFLQAFIKVGLVPDGGAAWLLSRAAGRPRAMEMMLLGDRIPAGKALDWGLINRVVADEAVDQTAAQLAATLAAGPSLALAMTRKIAWSAAQDSLEHVLHAERIAQTRAGKSADVREGVQAFMDKRAPNFSGI